MLNDLFIVIGYLRQRKFRTVLTTLAIVFGVAIIFSFNLILPGILAIYEKTLNPPGASDLLVQSVTDSAFDPSLVDAVSQIDGVKTAAGILHRRFSLPSSGQTPMTIEMIGLDLDTALKVSSYPVSSGRFLRAGDTGSVVVPASLAALANITVDSTFPLITVGGLKRYAVVGLLEERGLNSTPQIFVSLSDAQAAFNLRGKINAIAVKLAPGAQRETVVARIDQKLGSAYTAERSSGLDMAFASNLFNLFGALALFVGGFLVFNTFRTIVVERQNDIGMLRAIGADRSQIMRLILMESALQGVVGTIFGLLVGYAFAVGMAASFSQVFKGSIEVTVTPGSIGLPVLLGSLTTLVAGYFPARQAASISPLAALQLVSPEQHQPISRRSGTIGIGLLILGLILILAAPQLSGLGSLSFLLGAVLLTPTLIAPAARVLTPLMHNLFPEVGALALGNITRQPARTAVTVNTLMVGVAVLVATNALVGQERYSLTQTLNALLASDSSNFMLVPMSESVDDNLAGEFGVNNSLAGQIATLPDVAAVATFRAVKAQHGDQVIPLLGIDPVQFPKVRQYGFQEQEPGDPYATLDAGRAVFINRYIQEHLHLPLGSTLSLQTAQGPQAYRVVGVLDDFTSTVGIPYAVISQNNLSRDFAQTEDGLILIKLAAGTSPDQARTALEAILKNYPQFKLVVTADYRKAANETFSTGFRVFDALLFAVLGPALLGLLNTLTINILERTVEIGLLRAIGTDRGMVRRMIVAESLVLNLLGALIGFVVGVAMSSSFVSVLKEITPAGQAVFPLDTILIYLLVFLSLALLVSLIPARNAVRLNIVQALQHE